MRGNSCTDASQFTHYSLQAIGPAASFMFYGSLSAS
jgi:hypothetical protein